VSRPAVVAILTLFLGILVVPGCLALYLAACPGERWSERLLFLGLATVALFLPVRFAWLSVGRKWKTGRWSPGEEEIRRNRLKWANAQPPSWLRFVPKFLRNDAAGAFALDIDRLTALLWTPVACLWIYLVWHRHLRDWDLLFPTCWVLLSIYAIWKVVRGARRPGAAAQPPTG
jgi:hypothetical protein